MSRTLVLWAPDWPVVSVAAQLGAGGGPVAVLSKGAVLACSQSARAEGVRRGMRRRDAQSRCPDLVLHDHQPDADARAFEEILLELEQLTPGVAPLRPGLCALHVPSRFYGGEAEAGAVIAERLVALGVWDIRIGVADGLFVAEQAARRAPAQDSVVVPAGGSAAFLRDLPIDVLDTGGDGAQSSTVSLLRRMGLTTLGHFAALPAADVHTRFGSHGALLHRLSSGQAGRGVSRRTVPPELTATVAFEPPLDRIDQIAFSLRTTAESFVTALADRAAVCTAVRIEIDTDGSVASTRRWVHPRWFSATDLVDRVRWQLAPERPGERGAVGAPVDAVRLVPEVVEPLGDHADSLFGGGLDEQVERGVARVQGLVGHESVVSVAVQGGRGPAERHLLVPWGEKSVAARAAVSPWPGQVPPPAPATVFERPQEAWVVGAEGSSVGVTGRGVVTGDLARFRPAVGSEWLPVASWAGPWPVDDQWWDQAAARRIARFQVVGVDGSAWLMIVENGQWHTEAQYD
ncbi:DNA polymerase Y family protein [Aeromicrobium sp. CF3.5]|uniref:DNA polymerase Y family protein n=1 Tax=Aeromicrobium sp. CF3.5 TaxID=3373078 RepID=UPI003EE51944